MDLKQFFQLLRRRWVTILLLLAVSVGISGVLSLTATPQYESRAQIFISVDVRNTTDSYVNSLYVQGQIQSYAVLATSTGLLQEVASDLGPDVSPDDLAEQVSADVVPESALLEIVATDPDPAEAQRIARAESENLAGYLADLETPTDSDKPQITTTITNAADYNPTAVSPRTVLNLAVAVLIGLLVGIGVAVARQILDRSVSTLEHVQELTHAPVLASIGHDKEIKKSPLLTDLGGFAPRTEAFRLLRTNLQFLDLDEDPRCLVITSAVPGEGKTMVSTNLAIALAQAGRRTLLIDGDLRRPRVATQLGLDGAVGLTTVLVGSSDATTAVQVHEPSGLHFLASGAKPPNPTEILQSRVTHELITELRDLYDMVIIDAPPLLPVADASVLSTIADGTIIVVHHGKTSRDQLEQAVGRLHQVGARLFGVVVNQIPRRSVNSYYYYYYEEVSPRGKKKG